MLWRLIVVAKVGCNSLIKAQIKTEVAVVKFHRFSSNIVLKICFVLFALQFYQPNYFKN